jgi:hypothetical protein
MYSVVSPIEASQTPYPYAFVNEDGTVRELHETERKYLEEAFSPFDGARPYVKSDFECRDGWGSIKGFCHRSHIPASLPIASAPVEDPNPTMNKAELVEWLKNKMAGFEMIEKPDGTVEMKRITKE